MTFAASHELDPRLGSGGSTRGTVIFLNGTTSSGKSTLAMELMRLLDEPYHLMAIDDFHRRRSRKDWTEQDFAVIFQQTVLGFHRAIAGLASVGNNVVVDHILGERWRLLDCLEVLADFDVVFVGIRCGLDELVRREAQRGDRQIGRAAFQYPLVHAHGRYDLEVDTERYDAATCAAEIKAFVDSGRPGAAFATLRQKAFGSNPDDGRGG